MRLLPLLALGACAPRYSALPALAPADLRTPLPVQHVEVDGVDVAWIDSGGSGPPIVLVHGLSSYMGFWSKQVEHLSATHRVLALDLPGYGASGRPDAPYTPPWFAGVVDGWMTAIGIERAVVAGHSMGGQIALTLALDHPERVEALVLSAPAGFERFSPGHAAFMKEYWHEARALHTTEVEVRTAFRTAVFNHHDDGVEHLLEERVRLGRHPDFAGTSVAVSRSIAGMLDHPVLDRLEAVEVPALIVFGTNDRMIPNPVFTGGRTRAIAETGARALPSATLVLIEGAGHTVHHDAPEHFHAAVDPFLAGLPRPTAPPVDPPGVWDTAEASP